jgi:hypothetical protein
MTAFHTIKLEPWRSLGFGERVALETATALLWPLKADDRMTVLINLLAAQIENMGAGDDQIDALIDLVRLQLKLGLHDEQTEDQHRV